MRRGAVALFDALGFRGIWRKHNVDAVLKKLQALREGASQVVASFQQRVESPFVGTNVKPTLGVTLLSDTVVVSATVDGASDHTHAVTPFFSAEIQEPDATHVLSPLDAATLRDHILSTFDDLTLEVAIKKQHTLRFLDAAMDHAMNR